MMLVTPSWDGRLPLAVGWGVVVCDIADLPEAGLAAVDALARLQLSARRSGGELRARGVNDDLQRLWRWVGLSAVGPLADRPN